jgi:hypothetical protein
MQTQLTREQENHYRTLVEDAGAIFVGIQYGAKSGPIVLFQGAAGQSTIALYTFALKNVDDVRMAVKSKREQTERAHMAAAI